MCGHGGEIGLSAALLARPEPDVRQHSFAGLPLDNYSLITKSGSDGLSRGSPGGVLQDPRRGKEIVSFVVEWPCPIYFVHG